MDRPAGAGASSRRHRDLAPEFRFLFSDHHWAADKRCPDLDLLAGQPMIIVDRGLQQIGAP